MRLFKVLLATALAVSMTVADAKGGASSGGGHGGGGGHSSAGHSSSSSAGGSRGGFSSTPASRPAPAPTVAPPPRSSNVQPQAQRPAATTTTTTTRTVNTSSSSVRPAGNYGGMGPGYYHNDGLLTGLIIGNMMHPQNTVVYAGGGAHNGNALLYPDGRVVNQNGQQVGTYQNGQFAETPNGPMVAQPIPQSALQPVEKEKTVGEWLKDIALFTMLVFVIIILIILLRGMFL